MDSAALTGAFSNAPIDAAFAFRAAMNAMARPGRIERIAGATPPAPLSVAAGSLLLTLCDPETPLYLAGDYDCAPVRDWVTFHCGAPFAGPGRAMFAVGAWGDLAPLDAYGIGTAEYPDRSASLIVECEAITTDGPRLTGPGIESSASLSLPEVAAFQANATLFPLGLDFWFTAGDQIAALPRTTKVEAI